MVKADNTLVSRMTLIPSYNKTLVGEDEGIELVIEEGELLVKGPFFRNPTRDGQVKYFYDEIYFQFPMVFSGGSKGGSVQSIQFDLITPSTEIPTCSGESDMMEFTIYLLKEGKKIETLDLKIYENVSVIADCSLRVLRARTRNISS